jgi:hypothetical protein
LLSGHYREVCLKEKKGGIVILYETYAEIMVHKLLLRKIKGMMMIILASVLR